MSHIDCDVHSLNTVMMVAQAVLDVHAMPSMVQGSSLDFAAHDIVASHRVFAVCNKLQTAYIKMQTANCTCTANHAANKTVLRFAVQGHMAAGVASTMVVIKPRQVVPSPHVVPSAMQSPCADAAGAGAGAVAVLSTACLGRKPPFRAFKCHAHPNMRCAPQKTRFTVGSAKAAHTPYV
jgi:hypothetical protein